MTSYVACTSESIFEEKGKLWDVYVNNQNILLSDECKLELCTTPVDRSAVARTRGRHTRHTCTVNRTGRIQYTRLNTVLTRPARCVVAGTAWATSPSRASPGPPTAR